MDYSSLAGKYGGSVATPVANSTPNQGGDYSALATKYGATTPPPQQNIVQEAENAGTGLAGETLKAGLGLGQAFLKYGAQPIANITTHADYTPNENMLEQAKNKISNIEDKTGTGVGVGKVAGQVAPYISGEGLIKGAGEALASTAEGTIPKLVAKGLGRAGATYGIGSTIGDTNKGTNALVEGALPIVGAGLKSTAKAIFPSATEKATKTLQKIIDLTRDPVDTKKTQLGAIKSGQRTEAGILTKSKLAPTVDDVTRAHNIAPYFDPKASADTNIANLNAGVSDISNTKQLPLLRDNPNNLHWNEVNNYVENHTQDPKRVMSLFDGKAIVNNEDILNARQKLDQMINFEKKSTLPFTPERATVEQKAIQDRYALNSLIEHNLSTGGNIEGLNKVDNTIKGVGARGIPVDSAGRADLEKFHGVERNPENQLKATQFRQYLNQQHSLYDAINNIAQNTRKDTGKSVIGKALGTFQKNNPVTSAVIKKALPLGVAGVAIKEF